MFSNYDDLRNPWYGGGGARAIHEIARRLAERHQVHVVTGRYPGSRDALVDGVRYTRIGTAALGPYLAQLSFFCLLPWMVRKLEFDVWIESLTPPFSTACLQRFTSKPVVVLTQVLAGEGMRRKYRLPFDRIERWGLQSYRYAIAVSPCLAKRLRKINPQLVIKVIPNGTDRTNIEREVKSSPEHVLFLGRIDVTQKGLDLLLDSYALVARKIQVPLVIAGSGTKIDTNFLQRRITELGLTNYVRFVGRVEAQEKEDLLSRAICLVLPSRFEASPLVVIEAFCFQLPIVLFDISDLAWVPDECCVRVPAFDTRAFANAIEQLVRSPDLRSELGQRAKVEAAKFDWDRLARAYDDFLNSLLAK